MTYDKSITYQKGLFEGINRECDIYLKVLHATCKGKKVIDIACNTGFYTIKAYEFGANIAFGFDSNKEVLNAIPKDIISKRLYFEHKDFWEYLLIAEKYDIVLCNNCFYHIVTCDKIKEGFKILNDLSFRHLLMINKFFNFPGHISKELGDGWGNKYVVTYEEFKADLEKNTDFKIFYNKLLITDNITEKRFLWAIKD